VPFIDKTNTTAGTIMAKQNHLSTKLGIKARKVDISWQIKWIHKISIFWDITPCSPLKVRWYFRVPLKRWLTFNELHDITRISQKTEPFITTAVRTSYNKVIVSWTGVIQIAFKIIYWNLEIYYPICVTNRLYKMVINADKILNQCVSSSLI
jgi:hypothetical protein